MTSVSRPLIGLLVACVAFFAVWTLALKPSSSSSGGTKGGLGPYQSAIDKAHQAVANSQSAAAAQGSPVTATPTATGGRFRDHAERDQPCGHGAAGSQVRDRDGRNPRATPPPSAMTPSCAR